MPDTWFSMGVMLSAAGSLRWLHDELTPTFSYEELSARAETVPPGSLGLLFAPYLSGERHPHPDPLARGAFVGLTLRHTLSHMVRAVMEGVAFGMRDTLELLRAQGICLKSAAVSGGAANSPVWRQLMTDVMGIPLYTVNTTEGAAFGAAILAAVGAGAFPDVPSACAELVRKVDEIQPAPETVSVYEQAYALYRGLYPALRETNVGLAYFEEFSGGGMNWQEIRAQNPERWVLVEALDAFTKDGHRIIPTLRVINDFGAKWDQAWEHYKRLHHTDQLREYYVLHTEREVLNIGVIDAFGRILG